MPAAVEDKALPQSLSEKTTTGNRCHRPPFDSFKNKRRTLQGAFLEGVRFPGCHERPLLIRLGPLQSNPVFLQHITRQM